jgi:hypothetical protein
MSTLEMRVSHHPKAQSWFGGFAHVAAVLRVVLDVFNEARTQAYEAERRYPFMAS